MSQRTNSAESRQPKPAHAKRVFEGVIFDVYQWDQELYDGRTGIFEKLRRADSVGVLPVTTDGHILLIKENQPGQTEAFWELPGGRVDPGETAEQAALRELLEETGYQPQSLELWYALQPVSKIEWTVSVYVARGCERVGEPALDGGEKIENHLLTFDQFVETILSEQYYDSVLKVRLLEAKLDPAKMEAIRARLGLKE